MLIWCIVATPLSGWCLNHFFGSKWSSWWSCLCLWENIATYSLAGKLSPSKMWTGSMTIPTRLQVQLFLIYHIWRMISYWRRCSLDYFSCFKLSWLCPRPTTDCLASEFPMRTESSTTLPSSSRRPSVSIHTQSFSSRASAKSWHWLSWFVSLSDLITNSTSPTPTTTSSTHYTIVFGS